MEPNGEQMSKPSFILKVAKVIWWPFKFVLWTIPKNILKAVGWILKTVLWTIPRKILKGTEDILSKELAAFVLVTVLGQSVFNKIFPKNQQDIIIKVDTRSGERNEPKIISISESTITLVIEPKIVTVTATINCPPTTLTVSTCPDCPDHSDRPHCSDHSNH